MERGLKIPAKERGKTVNALLVSLMNQLEKDKKTVKLGPDDNMYLEGFATRVFTKADKQDRAGRADINTAKTFYAARIFFEVLHQFGEVPPDIEQRQKYAAWKAADIRKALSEGRKPVPGPPGGDEDLSEMDGMTWDTEGSPVKMTPTTSNIPPISPPEVSRSQPEEEELPASGVGPQQLQHDPLGRTTSFDSLPNPPTTAPASQSYHHARQASADDIDLPAAPTQPIYPGVQHPSPPHHQQGAPIPVIHDWSGDHSHDSAGPPYSGHYNYPKAPQDDYNANAPTYSLIPPSTSHSPYGNPTDQIPPSTTHSPFGNPSDPGYSYSQYPSQPGSGYQTSPPGSGYQGGNTYPSAPQNYGTGYADPPHHLRTTSAPIASQVSGYSSGPYPSDSNYQPPPDKIVEAHKAARFAVSSLAFDDVPTALEFLRKSLELLTVPQAS